MRKIHSGCFVEVLGEMLDPWILYGGSKHGVVFLRLIRSKPSLVARLGESWQRKVYTPGKIAGKIHHGCRCISVFFEKVDVFFDCHDSLSEISFDSSFRFWHFTCGFWGGDWALDWWETISKEDAPFQKSQQGPDVTYCTIFCCY